MVSYQRGSASATGDRASTSIYQVSVIVQRGTGTATVEQDVHVDNVGVADATSAGIANAQAVGNASSTKVNQIAVVIVQGSGDAQVRQTTDVTNAGVATAVAVDEHDATAAGNAATNQVTQLTVVKVGDQDVDVRQATSITNVGVATAGGGTSTGNTATNVVNQSGTTVYWLDIRPTNRWAMFDSEVSTQTEVVSPLTIVLRPGSFTGLYLAGMKSYGRAPTFLMITGYEQVRSIAADIAGDKEAAARVELELPETGVCTRGGLEGRVAVSGCCGGPAPAAREACCGDDARAKPAGEPGCGCS